LNNDYDTRDSVNQDYRENEDVNEQVIISATQTTVSNIQEKNEDSDVTDDESKVSKICFRGYFSVGILEEY